jgi:hypothetical protein
MVEAIDMVFGTAAFHECDDAGCDGQGEIAGCKDNRTDEPAEKVFDVEVLSGKIFLSMIRIVTFGKVSIFGIHKPKVSAYA